MARNREVDKLKHRLWKSIRYNVTSAVHQNVIKPCNRVRAAVGIPMYPNGDRLTLSDSCSALSFAFSGYI